MGTGEKWLKAGMSGEDYLGSSGATSYSVNDDDDILIPCYFD